MHYILNTPEKEKKIRKEVIESPRNKNVDSKNIGKFVINSDLGEGTFGKVKVGYHSLTGERVAIKVLEKKRILELADKTRVEREIKLLKMLRHVNIIHLYQVIQRATSIFLIMEFANGKDLFNYILNKKRIPEHEACEIFQQLISAVDYLHKFRIVHRDIKPENIILHNDKGKTTIKLIDFGLSNMYKVNELLKTQCGSPCYAAPEIISGMKYKGESVDVWSSGITLYTMVCGTMPFIDENNEVLYKKVTEGKYAIPSYLSEGLKDLIKHILIVDPEKRFKLEDIKQHPWFGYINPQRYSEGLLMNYHIMPIEERIVDQMRDQYDFKPEEIRLSILANKHSHITTTYYLLLNKFLSEGDQSSIADMTSSLFKDYISNPKNLLHNYNNDINIIIRERCQNLQVKTEDIIYIPIVDNNTTLVKDINNDTRNDKKKTQTLEKTTERKNSVSFNNQIEIINNKNELRFEYLIKPNCNQDTGELKPKNLKEKYLKLPDDNIMKSTQSLNMGESSMSENKQTNSSPVNLKSNRSINSSKKFTLGKLTSKKKDSSIKKTTDTLSLSTSHKVNNDQDYQDILITDRNIDIKVIPTDPNNSHNLLYKLYPKRNILNTIENKPVRGKNYSFKSNFIDTSMSYDNNIDSMKHESERELTEVKKENKVSKSSIFSSNTNTNAPNSKSISINFNNMNKNRVNNLAHKNDLSLSSIKIRPSEKSLSKLNKSNINNLNSSIKDTTIQTRNKRDLSTSNYNNKHNTLNSLNSKLSNKTIKINGKAPNQLTILKTYLGPIDINSLFFTSLNKLYDKLIDYLVSSSIIFLKDNKSSGANGISFLCEKNFIKFKVEICQIVQGQCFYLKFIKKQGGINIFKDICKKCLLTLAEL